MIGLSSCIRGLGAIGIAVYAEASYSADARCHDFERVSIRDCASRAGFIVRDLSTEREDIPVLISSAAQFASVMALLLVCQPWVGHVQSHTKEYAQ